MSIHIVRPGEGEMTGGGPIRVRIIEDGSRTEHRMGLIEFTVPPGPAQPPPHIHREHDEVFILTGGKLRFVSGSETFDAEAGSVVIVPTGTPHAFSNPFDVPATVLNVFTPDLYIQYFRDLAKLPVDAHGLLTPADIGRMMSRYATDVIRPA